MRILPPNSKIEDLRNSQFKIIITNKNASPLTTSLFSSQQRLDKQYKYSRANTFTTSKEALKIFCLYFMKTIPFVTQRNTSICDKKLLKLLR